MDKYLFLNRSYLQPQGIRNAKLTVCKAKKDEKHNPLFTEEFFANPPKKWEVRYDNGYPNVIYDEKYGVYRLYYTLFTKDTDSATTPREDRSKRDYMPHKSRITSLCYAESKDGIHWEKPNLGLVEFEGSTDNNILFRYAHGTGIMLDTDETDSKKRYKLVTKVEYPGNVNFMAVNFSEDGIHWGEMIKWPHINPAADSHNLPFRDKQDGLYKVISRVWKDGVRISVICTSRDFLNWSAPMEIIRGNGYEDQVYSMPVFWQDRFYLGLASMFHEGDREDSDFDTVDLELTIGTDAQTFDRVAPKQYLIERGAGHYPTGEFDCGCIYAAPPVEIDGKLYIYYMGGNGQHTNFRETSFARASLEKDRFAYYEAKDETRESIVPTYTFNAYGDRFFADYDCAKDGKLEIAVAPSFRSKAYDGFDFTDCVITKDEKGLSSISWKKPLTSLETEDLVFIFRFNNCRLYSFSGDIAHQNARNYEGAAVLS